MHESSKKKPEHCYHNSATEGAVNCPPWWSSTSSVMPHSSLKSSLNLNLDATRLKELHVKDLGGQLQGHGSPSTQSTGQSRHDSGIVGRGSLETNGEQLDSSTRHMVSLGNTDFLYPAEQVNFSQSVVHIPYACADPFFGGLVAAYTPQIHTQLYGVAPNRVPLPDLAEAEPIYVNAKQYHVILKRRESRAKLEAQNKLVKNRKPYLHESRHRHAMTRARGSGGRFLNTKEYQNSETNPAVDSDNGKSLALGFRRQNQIESESEVNKREIATSVGSATLSFSCVNLSDNDGGGMLRQSEKEYGAFHSHMVGNLQDGGGTLHHGTQ